MRNTSSPALAEACSDARSSIGQRPRTRRPGDRWEGLSQDAIERFLDVMRVEGRLEQAARSTWSAHLLVLDDWCRMTLGRTLVGVNSCGLRAFIRQCTAAGVNSDELAQLTAVLRHFYRYLRDAKYRDDDPSCRLPQGPSQQATATH